MRRHRSRLAHLGFTLVEVMIALLIGVIGIVIMMQTFAVSEGFKRTATSGTDAQVNGALAMYMMEREVRLAGYGLNALTTMGCGSVRVWNSTNGTGFDLRLIPFEINPAGVPAGDPNTDTVMVTFGNADSFVSGVQADQPLNTAPSNFVLYSNREGFKNGDLFVSVMPGAGAGGLASCVLHEATQVPAAAFNCGLPPPTPTTLVHDQTNYKSFANGCKPTDSIRNSAGGIRDAGGAVVPVVRLSQGGQLFNLGVPTIHVFAVRNGNLTMCNWMATDCGNAANYDVVVNDIVSLRFVYGMNTTPAVDANPGDGVVTWGRAPLTGNVFLPSRVMSVAIAVTARSGVKEKTNQANACDATPNAGRPDRTYDWMYQSMAGAAIDISTSGTDWGCYRYKLFQSRVPVRNAIWRP